MPLLNYEKTNKQNLIRDNLSSLMYLEAKIIIKKSYKFNY